MGRGPEMSKGKDSNQEAGTPQWLFDAIDNVIDFGIDLAASATNTKCKSFLSLQDNSLVQPWHSLTNTDKPGWCNHPYKNCSLWVQKAHDEAFLGATVVQLQPAALHRNYYKKLVKGKDKPVAVVVLNRAIKFDGYDCASSILHGLFIWNKGLIGKNSLYEADPRDIGELADVLLEIKGLFE